MGGREPEIWTHNWTPTNITHGVLAGLDHVAFSHPVAAPGEVARCGLLGVATLRALLGCLVRTAELVRIGRDLFAAPLGRPGNANGFFFAPQR